MMSSS